MQRATAPELNSWPGCVSVSTSGSKGVQPRGYLRPAAQARRFSIHKRIEGGATRKGAGIPVPLRWFQYPQADRRGCNFHAVVGEAHLYRRFSIHKRIEGGATRIAANRFCTSLRVSVSTSGSKGVQQMAKPIPQWINDRFSIHKRIEGGATDTIPSAHADGSTFQYPQADRRGCNFPIYIIYPK